MLSQWYAAHIVMLVRFKDGQQNTFPVWENVVLIEATTPEEASDKAQKRAHQDEGDSDGNFTWDDRPAEWVFAGIRKLLTCREPHERPSDGTEVTYSEFVISSQDSFDRFVNGQATILTVAEE